MIAAKVEPASANFAQIPRKAPAQTKTVTLTRGDAGPLTPRVLSINSSPFKPGLRASEVSASQAAPPANPAIKAELREIEAGERYELDVTVSPPWPNSMLQGSVTVQTGIAEAPQEVIPVSVTLAPRLAVQPQLLRIPPQVDSDLDLTAKLIWSDNNPGKVVETTVNDAKLQVQAEDLDGQPVVVLHVPAGYQPSRSAGLFVTVKTDDPEAPTLQIQIAGRQASPTMLAPRGTATRPALTPAKPVEPRSNQQ
jgi:hypothetical protein